MLIARAAFVCLLLIDWIIGYPVIVFVNVGVLWGIIEFAVWNTLWQRRKEDARVGNMTSQQLRDELDSKTIGLHKRGKIG